MGKNANRIKNKMAAMDDDYINWQLYVDGKEVSAADVLSESTMDMVSEDVARWISETL